MMYSNIHVDVFSNVFLLLSQKELRQILSAYKGA